MTKSKLKQYFSNPLWYLTPSEEIQKYIFQASEANENLDSDGLKEWKNERREFIVQVGKLLKNKEVTLAKEGTDFDSERKEIDTIVIHHTGNSSTEVTDPIAYISAMHMLQIYMPNFLNEKNSYAKTELWSNHFYRGKMTFFSYHYLIWPDGKYEQILKDKYIGWHCGNWEFNKKSIGICFLADLENAKPTDNAINSAKEIINKYPKTKILGHREIKESTTCPGNLFLGEDGWKKALSVKR